MENDKEIKFIHKVSKGSRFNQIYVPLKMSKEFDVGDRVEVRLLENKNELFTHNAKLTKFKENLIKDIFKFLGRHNEIKQMFIIGSFLIDKFGYNDIDIFLITEKEKDKKFDDKILAELSNEFNLKFHVISGVMKKLIENLKFSPLMRSMLAHFVSNAVFKIPSERIIDKNHILYLMMSPEDLLEEEFDRGRIYYDSMRKLIIIEKFLEEEEEDIVEANRELELNFDRQFIMKLKRDDFVNKKCIKIIRNFISDKLRHIKRRLRDEQIIRHR